MVNRIEIRMTPDEYASLPYQSASNEEEKDLTSIIRMKLGRSDDFEYSIIKKSIDARRKNRLLIIFQIEILNTSAQKQLQKTMKHLPKIETRIVPVVVGLGPAGLFAALYLSRLGFRPIVLERGCAVQERVKDVEDFIKGGVLKPYSNIQFGEGGAGTFSDGKLYSGIKNTMKNQVLSTLVEFGAPKEILYDAHPHIGSDRLRDIIPNISSEIIRCGGKILYNRTMTDIHIENERIIGLVHEHSKDFQDVKNISCDVLILAPGHSARQTFKMLEKRGVKLESKPFSVGVRIEHCQEWIDRAQYGQMAGHEALPVAAYKLAVHPEKTRALYSFCMCPGGYVIPAASDCNQVVTNGMSMYKRDGKNANAAILVSVDYHDFSGKGPLSGMFFQQELEESAFKMGGENGFAPCQRVGDFLDKKPSVSHGEVYPSYLPGVKYTHLHELFPDYINQALSQGIIEMGKKIKGFSHPDALLTAVETRSSSPIRIIRDSAGESISIRGIFPCGEGSGYAGGIMSSAIDGLRVVDNILKNLQE